jgi:cytochrome c5
MKLQQLAVAATLALAACGPDSRPTAQAPVGGTAALSRGDRLLLVAATVALPPDWIGPTDLPDANSRGARLVVAYCRQCHSLPTPRAHGASDWPVVVRRMWLRMEGLPDSLRVEVPTPAERADILQYLTANALKVNTGPLPPGKGREAFVTMCSRCHAAPDPAMHSKEEWPVVIARVERNMKRMNVAQPTGMESEDILAYLQAAAGAKRSGSR